MSFRDEEEHQRHPSHYHRYCLGSSVSFPLNRVEGKLHLKKDLLKGRLLTGKQAGQSTPKPNASECEGRSLLLSRHHHLSSPCYCFLHCLLYIRLSPSLPHRRRCLCCSLLSQLFLQGEEEVSSREERLEELTSLRT